MLISRRPKLAFTLPLALTSLFATMFLVAFAPENASADPVNSSFARSEAVASLPRPTVRKANKAVTRRPLAPRLPSLAQRKIIKSIPSRVSSGFTPSANGFSFANWSTDTAQPTITANTLIRLFGVGSTCESFDQGVCVPYRKALGLIEQLNGVLANGRCEGMVALADELFRHPHLLAGISPTGSSISSLTPEETSSEIAYWWATQIMPKATKFAETSRTMSPTKIVQTISRRLMKSSGTTLGMYYNGKGHSVLPIGVTRTRYAATISVYDSNTPKMVQYVRVNLRTNTWRYRAVSADGALLLNWHGRNSGGLDIVTPAVRSVHSVTSFSETTP